MPPVSSGKSPPVQPDISQPLVDGPFAAPREDHPSLPIAVGEALSTSASSPRLGGRGGLARSQYACGRAFVRQASRAGILCWACTARLTRPRPQSGPRATS
jgi:hypothetical protein